MFQVRLKELREKAGYTQETLAEVLHVRQSTVGMWENGKNKPKNARLEALANLFHVSTDYLLGRSEEPSEDAPSASDPAGLSDDEKRLVANYRKLNRGAQEYILWNVQSLAESPSAQEGLFRQTGT